MDRVMISEHRVGNPSDQYRGQSFMVRAQLKAGVWTSHYRLTSQSSAQASAAQATTDHRWTPLDPAWATESEALMNATEAAHAAINAFLSDRS